MRWFQGKRAGLLAFLLITLLVMGGLAWVTTLALELEDQQCQARAETALYGDIRLALWRLDSHVFPILAKEASRPYDHYRALYTPPVALMKKGNTWAACRVYQPSPLINEELPSWAILHFQTTPDTGLLSPQVLALPEAQALNSTPGFAWQEGNLPERERLLSDLRKHLDTANLVKLVEEQAAQQSLSLGMSETIEQRVEPSKEDNNQEAAKFRQTGPSPQPASNSASNRYDLNTQAPLQQSRSNFNTIPPNYGGKDVELRAAQRKGIDDQTKKEFVQQQVESPQQGAVKTEQVQVRVGPLTPLWLPVGEDREMLVLARVVHVGDKTLCQGLFVDWPKMEASLIEMVSDLFPDARLLPVRDAVPPHPERTMTALPLELEPNAPPLPASPAGWTPLRIGLVLSWVAAVVALATVGLGGWSLIDLSERRIRFVSAVTHELRTPLTTLRLYLDMLTSGIIREEQQRNEYLQTLHTESERLHRLIGNVLDFSRLENQRTHLEKTRVAVADLVEQVRSTWTDRCRDAGKELVIENQVAADTSLVTDPGLVQQVLGNLIDNACKYSRHAEDPRVWLRVRMNGNGTSSVAFEVEDRGPGVSPAERRSIFRPFTRGRGVDTTASGVGLGLALADRWARLLGGRLELCTNGKQTGACFRLEV